MRARNIKPALFKNEVLGQADPLYTLLFEGLWCAADREGRLEDRPLRLRAEIFPYRPNFDMEASLNWLKENCFIDRYLVGDARVIQVCKFLEHQRPHANEVPSALPAKVESTSCQGRKRAPPTKAEGDKDFALNPSSLIPDSPSLIPETGHSPRAIPAMHPIPDEPHIRAHVDAIKAAYPKAGRMDWITAEKGARNLVLNGDASWVELVAGVERYAKHCAATGRIVSNPARFFADIDKPWSQEWPIPAGKAAPTERPPRKTRYAQMVEGLNITSEEAHEF